MTAGLTRLRFMYYGFFLDQSGILSVMKFSVGQEWMVRKPRQ